MTGLWLPWGLSFASHILNSAQSPWNAASHLVLGLVLVLGVAQPASATIIDRKYTALVDILCDLAKALHVEKLALDLGLLPCDFQVVPTAAPSISPDSTGPDHKNAFQNIYATVVPTPSHVEVPARPRLPVGVNPPDWEELVYPYSLILAWFLLMVWAFAFPTWGWSRWAQTPKERTRRAAALRKNRKRAGFSLRDLEVAEMFLEGAQASVKNSFARQQNGENSRSKGSRNTDASLGEGHISKDTLFENLRRNSPLREDNAVQEILLNYPHRIGRSLNNGFTGEALVDQRYPSVQSAYRAAEASMKNVVRDFRGKDVPFRIKLRLQSGSERYVYYSPDDFSPSDVSEDECLVDEARGSKFLTLEDVPALSDDVEQIIIDERSMLACGDLAYVALALNYVKFRTQSDETPN